MKTIENLVFFILLAANTFSQDIINHYDPDNITGNFTFSSDLKLEMLSETLIINNTQIWVNKIDFYGSYIYIESGATLTIQNTLTVSPETKIIVKRGGQLIIDGGTITGNEMWQGIEVWGTKDQPQSLVYQGLVRVKNGGTIENAICGIRAVKMEIPAGGEGEAPVLSYSGGIVFASNAVLKNNVTAARFYDYDHNSSSHFTDCLFKTTYSMINGEQPKNFVKLTSIDGVEFINSSFVNSSSTQYWGNGIYSTNSHYKVKGKCINGGEDCIEWDNGLFKNLEYGIYATASSPNKHIEVEHSDFEENFRGVYIGGMSNAVVTYNNFNINTLFTEDGGYGMYLDRSTAYKVEENHFIHNTGEKVGIGLIVNESGDESNEIYRNWFTNLECGMDIQGKNRSKSGEEGLQLKCNKYDYTKMDKIIIWDLPIIPIDAGIASNQGASFSNPEDMAGNLFQIDDENPNDDYDDILNEANHITYYYPLQNNDIRVKPVDYTHNTVTPTPIYFNPQWTYENGCPPSDDPGGGGGIGDTKGKMADAEQKIDSTENLLSLLIDGGNTFAVQNEVDNSVPPQTMQVYNDLMNKSPYLSDTVISTAIEKEDVLPGAMIRDIMVANPKAVKSEKLMQKLDERWNPLPEYMKAQILQGRSIVSIREETESRLAAFKLEKAKYFNVLVRHYLDDTVYTQASLDSLAMLLQSENSLNSRYSLAMLKGEQGEWNEGLAVLNNIPSQFDLTLAEVEEYSQFTTYYTLLLGMLQEGKSIFEADSTQIETLIGIEAQQSGMASVFARNILLTLNEMEYEEPIILPDLLKSAEATDRYNELLSKAGDAPVFVKVQPNPAKDYVIIEYKLEREADAVIEINSITGNLKYSVKFANRHDQFTVDTRIWKAGIYIATLKINGSLIESVKFTIID